ncbi:hypothetical protein [Brevundimonas vesicularis]|uniref:Uncharacterized protein n=1 Tax=Brevundimonas vesicularis TaxID=41276 RepID=A0A1Z3U7W8_BREVE|nr:hypothetical protein [Brevundimonas vesicularis]ASE39369.1 hypothetical protein CEP68_07550 [Brevundimonas vesicularis]
MKLSADHPLDTVEMAWALERRANRHSIQTIAQQSGRPETEWTEAMHTGEAAFAPNAVIEERYVLVRDALRIGLSMELMSIAVRAPRAWCAEAGKREMARCHGSAS